MLADRIQFRLSATIFELLDPNPDPHVDPGSESGGGGGSETLLVLI
jgi:hypothetical protein